MLIDQISQSVVRIFDHKTNIVGCGLFWKDNVLTCAHVINQALGISPLSDKKPTASVNFDLPLVASGRLFTGRITTWLPEIDIASLEIVSSLPKNLLTPKFIKADDLWGHSFRAYGFPRGLNEGVWASGKILHRVSNGWVEIEDVKQTGYFVQPGFSGGAVWDEDYQGIVGLVIGADANLSNRVAYIVPTIKLIEAFSKINEIIIDPIDTNLNHIRELIRLGSYTEAYEKCTKALLNSPDNPILNLFSVIALLKGVGADKQHAAVIAKIQKHLSIVCNFPKFNATGLAILGIIKYDRYIRHGLDEGTPSIEEIHRALRNSELAQVDSSFVKLINASDSALDYLGLQ